MNYTEVLQKFAADYLAAAKELIKAAPYDKSYKAQVTAVISDGKVKVRINGQERTAATGTRYAVGNYVWVCIPRNNWNNLYVVCKA